MLRRRDPEAFRERSAFFTLDDMKAIITEYVRVIMDMMFEAERRLDGLNSTRSRTERLASVHIYGMGMVRKDHIRPIRFRYEKFRDAVNNAHTYAELSGLLEGFDFNKAEQDTPSSDHFAKCFIESGAFYTLKQMIMFEGLSLGGRDVKENLDMLKDRGRYGYMSLYRELRV